ncbi:MAG: hypothetical protein ACOCV2_13630, partial [Persicimonas sp.]
DLDEHWEGPGTPFDDLDRLRGALDDEARERLDAALGIHEPPEPLDEAEETSERSLSFSQLRRFLESPLQASARWVLGLRREEADDILDRDDEPFAPSYVGSLVLARDVFLRASREGASVDGADFAPVYDEQARHLELKGELPTGPFGDGARTQHLKMLETWRDNLSHLDVPCDAPLSREHFGRARRHEHVDQIRDSLAFELDVEADDGDLRELRVELYGKTELLDADRSTSITLLSRDRVYDRDFLRGYITHLVLAAAGLTSESEPFTAVLAPNKSLANARKMSKYRREFAPVGRDAARAQLEQLCADCAGGVHPYLMPIEAVTDYADPDNDAPFDEIVEGLLTRRYGSCSAEYGPIAHPERFPVPADVDAIIERRLGRFLGAVE